MQIEELVATIDQQLSPSQSKEALEILLKIFRNILKSQDDPKFRILKKENRLVSEKLGKSSAAISVLLEAGFRDEGATHVLPASASVEVLQAAADLLEAILVSKTEDRFPEVHKPSTIENGVITRQHLTASQASTVSSPVTPLMGSIDATAGVAAQAPSVEAKKKPAKSAFDFQSRSERERVKRQAAEKLDDLKRAQKAKYKEFQTDPNAQMAPAYKLPPAVELADKKRPRWCGCFSRASS